MQLITKKFFIILKILIIFFTTNNLYSSENQFDDYGIIALMYHRFEETNILLQTSEWLIFKAHIDMINEQNIKFVNPNNFVKELKDNKATRKVLLTIDDGFLSFYNNAWPLLKEKEIPFILCKHKRGRKKRLYVMGSNKRGLKRKIYTYREPQSFT